MPKERPILFSTEMVKAILDGRKTQTRRVIKPQPTDFMIDADHYLNKTPCVESKRSGWLESIACPYGQPGDLLWVRETFCPMVKEHHLGVKRNMFAYKANACSESEEARTDYIKAGYPYQWKPSIHMPKKAARIWLEVEEVRVERLQDISDKDAISEGINYTITKVGFCGFDHYSGRGYNLMTSAKTSFLLLWNKIHGLGRYEKPNPYVWAVSYKVLSTEGRPNVH